MKTLLFALLICACLTDQVAGQVKNVYIGVSGLTCSACSKSVEMKLRKLDFIQDVDMNLEHTQGTIDFKPNVKVDFDKIAQAVYDAGFSISEMKATISPGQLPLNNSCFDFQGDKFMLLKGKLPQNEKILTLKFIGQKFLSKKDYKLWKPLMKKNCGSTSDKNYYVTL